MATDPDIQGMPQPVVANGKRRRIWVALLYLVISQAIFWPLLIGMELLSRPSGSTAPQSITMQFAEREHPQYPDPIALTRDSVPSYSWSDPSPPDEAEQVVYSHEFDAIETGADMALYMGWVRRVVAIEVNGSTVRSQTELDHWGVLGGFEASAFIIPAEILKPTNNQLRIIGEGRSKKVAPAFYLSTPEDVLSAVSWGRLFDVELVIAAIAVMSMVLLLVLLARWPARDRYRMNGLAALLGAWILKNLVHLNIIEPTSDDWRMFFTFLVIFVFLGALCFFLVRWLQAKRSMNSWVIAGFSALIGVLALLNIWAEPIIFFRTAFWVETILTSIIGLAGGCWLAWKAAGPKDLNAEYGVVETLLFLTAISVIVLDAIDDQFDVMLPVFDGLAFVNYKAPAFGIFLGLGLCATLAAQATATRNITRKANLELQRRVDAQAQELARSFERTRDLERQSAINEERQRILRDMHDGIGSLLLGLSMQIQGGKLQMEEVHDGIRKGITDLRLMVTAMDGVGDDLVFALGAFEQRIRPDLLAAGITLEVQVELPDDRPTLGSRTVLNLYRLLQEAITNTIRHSQATMISVIASEEATDPGATQITICDNGRGFDLEETREGRGLANMRQRARAIGARIEWNSSSGGTCITVHMPG